MESPKQGRRPTPEKQNVPELIADASISPSGTVPKSNGRSYPMSAQEIETGPKGPPPRIRTALMLHERRRRRRRDFCFDAPLAMAVIEQAINSVDMDCLAIQSPPTRGSTAPPSPGSASKASSSSISREGMTDIEPKPERIAFSTEGMIGTQWKPGILSVIQSG